MCVYPAKIHIKNIRLRGKRTCWINNPVSWRCYATGYGRWRCCTASLYKPLAENDSKMISRIFVSAGKFFRKIALILLIYVIALMCFYPFSVNKSFGILYTVLLIGSMCVSSFAQYYFGVVNGLLLTADQKGYIQYTSKSVTLFINTLACVVLIQLGCSIHIVKLTTSLIFLLRPTYLQRYVKNITV